jgi:hypothetical protein
MIKHCVMLAAFSGAALTACSSSSDSVRLGAASHGQAQCVVCKCNADLACVDVRVNPDTPRVVHHDQTLYFCSEYCREAFIAKPEKYVRR